MRRYTIVDKNPVTYEDQKSNIYVGTAREIKSLYKALEKHGVYGFYCEDPLFIYDRMYGLYIEDCYSHVMNAHTTLSILNDCLK